MYVTLYNPERSKALKPKGAECANQNLGEESLVLQYRPPIPPVTVEQAIEMLRWEESDEIVARGSGVLRFDTNRVASNMPCEDEYISAAGHDDMGTARWLIWGIFDGHSGGQTSLALYEFMLPYILRELEVLSTDGTLSDIAEQNVDVALKAAFESLDNDILNTAAKALSQVTSFSAVNSQLAPAFAGSCALVSFYNCDSKLLKVACTGDSRAVLGRRNAAGTYEAIELSDDQTGSNEVEVARIRAAHPNEPWIFNESRVLGLGCSRAFGDARFKWPRVILEASHRFFGPSVIEPYLTPPYLTADPVFTTTRIEPGQADFIIMASDGLWDKITSEQAVELVERWLQTHDPSKKAARPNLAEPPTHTIPQQPTHRNTRYSYSKTANEKDFVVADENAATHLVRNAFGGGNTDMLCGLLTAGPPHSRNMRDDITVQVIFFGQEDSTIHNN